MRNTAEALGIGRSRRLQIMLQDATEGLSWRAGAPPPGRFAAAAGAAAAALVRLRAGARIVAFRSWRMLQRGWQGAPLAWGAPPPPRGVVAWQ